MCALMMPMVVHMLLTVLLGNTLCTEGMLQPTPQASLDMIFLLLSVC